MDSDLMQKERERFNSLSQDEAKKIADEVDGASPAMRSCWYCNGAHEHLRDADYFTCFSCGISFVRGYPTPILGRRMRNEEIDDVMMKKIAEVIDDAANGGDF